MKARVLIGVVVVGGALVGCLGADIAPGASGDGVEPSEVDRDGGAGAAPGATSSGATTSGETSSGATTSGGTTSGGESDAGQIAVDAETDAASPPPPPPPPLPTPTCTNEAYAASVYNFRCSASASTITPGGAIATAGYRLSRWWEQGGCFEIYRIGSATVFEQDGALFMRFVRAHKTAAGDAGTTHHGTYLLQPGANGTMVRTERCDAAKKGVTETGSYAFTPGAGTPDTLTFVFGTRTEVWERIP